MIISWGKRRKLILLFLKRGDDHRNTKIETRTVCYSNLMLIFDVFFFFFNDIGKRRDTKTNKMREHSLPAIRDDK